MDAAAALDAGLVALRHERDSRLRIAASMTVAEYLLPVWLTALRAVDPGAVVALSAVNSAEVAQAVLADAADIGFIEGPEIPDGLHAGAGLTPARNRGFYRSSCSWHHSSALWPSAARATCQCWSAEIASRTQW